MGLDRVDEFKSEKAPKGRSFSKKRFDEQWKLFSLYHDTGKRTYSITSRGTFCT
jgi:hypothetical protein